MDLYAVSYSGLTQTDADRIKELDSVNDVEGFYTAEAILSLEERTASAKFISLPERINTLTLREGRFPENKNECVILRTKDFNRLMDVGNTITFDGEFPSIQSSYKIVGTVDSPEFISFELGSSTVGTGRLDYIIYTTKDSFPILDAAGLYSQIAITVRGASELDTYSDIYQETVDAAKADVEKRLGSDSFVLDRDSNVGFVSYEGDAEKIDAISKIFPIFFFLVAALVCLTTMTRMVEEERIQIGTMKALGYGKPKILFKYIFYSFTATVTGSILGLVIGYNLFPRAIFAAYSILYTLPSIETPFHWTFGAATTFAALLCTEIFTIAACINTTKEVPAALMLPKAPKMGKRILLERISFLWKRMSFNQKVTMRNIFRYKKRFFMTIFGISGSMALMLVGFGLRDSIMDIARRQYQELQHYTGTIIDDEDATDKERQELDEFLKNDSQIERYTHVQFTKMSVPRNKSNISVYVYVPENLETFNKDVTLQDRKTKEKYKLTEAGTVISEKTATLTGLKVGDTMTITKDGKNYETKIAAVTENYMGHYIYMTGNVYEQIFGEKPDYSATVFTVKEEYKESESEVGNEILKYPAALSISYTSSLEAQLHRMLGALDTVIIVLIISAGMLAFVVLYNLNNVNITERQRELATLKVLGFYDTEVSAYVYRENVILTLIGVLAGAVFGIFLHRYIIRTVEVDAVMFGRNINPVSFLYCGLLTIGFSMIVNLFMHQKLKKIDMVESLKSVE